MTRQNNNGLPIIMGRYFGSVSKIFPAIPGTPAHPIEPPMIKIEASFALTGMKLSAYRKPVANEFDIAAPNNPEKIYAITLKVLHDACYLL